MQQKTNSDLSRHYLPRQLRHLILQEYLSGVKTARQLSEEHGIPMSTIHKMGQRWKAKNSCSFVSTPNPYPIMSRAAACPSPVPAHHRRDSLQAVPSHTFRLFCSAVTAVYQKDL